VQSHVKAHAELCWLLTTQTPMSWLERMIQYKEKALRQGDSVGVGLFGYPVLMAADILLYQADKVFLKMPRAPLRAGILCLVGIQTRACREASSDLILREYVQLLLRYALRPTNVSDVLMLG